MPNCPDCGVPPNAEHHAAGCFRLRLERGANLNTPEPAPTPGGADVWPLVIADMHERNRAGVAKYGTPLQAHNGRRPLVDAYQEVLDLAVYVRQEIEERRAQPNQILPVGEYLAIWEATGAVEPTGNIVGYVRSMRERLEERSGYVDTVADASRMLKCDATHGVCERIGALIDERDRLIETFREASALLGGDANESILIRLRRLVGPGVGGPQAFNEAVAERNALETRLGEVAIEMGNLRRKLEESERANTTARASLKDAADLIGAIGKVAGYDIDDDDREDLAEFIKERIAKLDAYANACDEKRIEAERDLATITADRDKVVTEYNAMSRELAASKQSAKLARDNWDTAAKDARDAHVKISAIANALDIPRYDGISADDFARFIEAREARHRKALDAANANAKGVGESFAAASDQLDAALGKNLAGDTIATRILKLATNRNEWQERASKEAALAEQRWRVISEAAKALGGGVIAAGEPPK